MQHCVRRSPGLLVALAVAFALAGCFEDPIEEELHLCLPNDETFAVVVDIALHGDSEDDNAAERVPSCLAGPVCGAGIG